MLTVKKNDMVRVLAGKDRGKTGKVLKVFPGGNRAVVQGINFAVKHQRRTGQNEQGGIMHRESAMDISNLAVICKSCDSPTRVGIEKMSDRTKVRYCRKCKEVL